MLLLSLIWAWTAWNVYHPYKSTPELIGVFSFIIGMITGELALHVITLEVGLTLLIILFGELSGIGDALGLGIALCSWTAIAVFYFRAQRADPIMAQAVRYALETPSEQTIDSSESILLEATAKRLAKPFNYRLDNVRRHKNIEYAQCNGRSLRVDIYHRGDTPKNAPVLFQMHGGAWLEKVGSKNEQALPLMNQMATNGWVCVAVEYRLSPGATFPDHIIDCKRALCWIKENIAEYGGNPNFVIATGGSAGGHLSSLLALSANAPEFQPGFEHIDTTVQACIPFYGVYDFLNSQGQRHSESLSQWISAKVLKQTRTESPELWRQASPLYWVSDKAPPFLIIHGEADTLVPVEESRVFYKTLQAVSQQAVSYAELPDAQHAFDIPVSLRTQIVVNHLCVYLNELYRRHQQNVDKQTASNQEDSEPELSDN
ncbi:Carboxylesterase NlhH [Zhongshania aliphaticivorans]|uniref:Carboxylesterase NlhH n=1 Tax=Zhongshania aliphaticivorans TaxID=1470434 RepID=A0A5S9MMY6_9GAMM|nr:alpha/beta hydrolase [Zhongshania aliphaticivorans]CAA0078314.1 Carboxylesterase NlhH [Zhongshania aliphaticivorans]CAA0086734.1 Carboxylesterase NlhH [Zhongshania aliphaticivorans]